MDEMEWCAGAAIVECIRVVGAGMFWDVLGASVGSLRVVCVLQNSGEQQIGIFSYCLF